MTSKATEEKIQFLEQRQWALERDLQKHRERIELLRTQYHAEQNAQKNESPPIKIEPIKEIKEPVSLLENLKIPEYLTEKKSKTPQHLSHNKPKVETPDAVKPKRNLREMEQNFGKVWFVRLGIISLLTGLVFLSNFAYKNFIIEWGAGARLGGMYLLATFLLGLGTYFEKAKAALSNYGKVLAAGGIATLYYTSYAAHHVERLKVIDSAFTGGLLLTASAAVCLIYALWKRSNITAVCAIALAYYSTSINPVGAFSLISGLLLTLTGLILLHRLRSASIGFTSMLGGYLSFIYWQLLVNHGATSYAYTSWFIIGYWILSTASFLIPRAIGAHPFSKTQLMTFASLNNAFMVLLMSIDFQALQWAEPLWPVSAGIGTIFITLALYLQFGEKLTSAIQKIPFRSSLSSLFLLKGIALITMALCLKLTGPSLALSLTIQAGLLLIASCRADDLRRTLLTFASYLVLALGFFIYLGASSQNLTALTLTHFIMALLYLGISLIAHFGVPSTDDSKQIKRAIPAIFSIIATSCCIIFAPTSVFSKVTILFGLNLGFTVYQYFSNRKNVLPDFCHGSHVFTVIGCLMTLQHLALFSSLELFCVSLMLFAATAVNLRIFLKRGMPHSQYIAYLIVATASLLLTLLSTESVPAILLLGSLIPVAYHAVYQQLKQHKLRLIAILGFIVYPLVWFAYLVSYIGYFYGSHMLLHLIVALIPLAHLLLIRQNLLSQFKSIIPLLTIATAAMFALWQITYIGPWELSLALTAGVYHLLDQKENRLLTIIAGVFYSSSIMQATLATRTSQPIIDIIALLPLLVYFSRRLMLGNLSTPRSAYYVSTQRGIAVIASLTMWIISSQHLVRFYDSSAISIVWAIVGLIILSLGFINRDIVFRTMAFIILGCTVLHVYGVDVWRLNAILRIISFITLGIVLLITGYLYCRKVDQDSSTES